MCCLYKLVIASTFVLLHQWLHWIKFKGSGTRFQFKWQKTCNKCWHYRPRLNFWDFHQAAVCPQQALWTHKRESKGTKTILQYVDICTETLLVFPSSASTLKPADSVYHSALRFITPVQIISLGKVPLTFLLYILWTPSSKHFNALASIGHFKSIITSYSTPACNCYLIVCIRCTIFSLYVLIMHVYAHVYTCEYERERFLLTSISTSLCSGHTLQSPVTQVDGQS